MDIGTSKYMANKTELYDRDRHHNLRADLLEHVFNAQVNAIVADFEYEFIDDTNDESNMFIDDSGENYDEIISNND